MLLAPPSPRQPKSLNGLRHKLAVLEGTTRCAGGDNLFALDLPPIDAALAGGLARGALHEISARAETHTAAASRFALALAGVLLKQSRAIRARACSPQFSGKAIIWIAQDLCLFENGIPYGPGLVDIGIAPEQLIVVAAPRMREMLWAMEEALRCRAIGVVIGEIGTHTLDQVAARRLSLAADAGNTLGLLLRAAPDDAACACATRWIIDQAPSAVRPENEERYRGIGPPRLYVHLLRNRRGHPGAWLVEWNSVEQRFELATDSVPLAQSPFDRSRGAVVA
jgi:protein ImuA